MVENILERYFKGVTAQIQDEIDYITSILKHTGEKGKANEKILRELLIKFLPKKYSIGSGIIIDQEGNQSNQCDIIIYDNQYNPELFGWRTPVIFPVDVVYAVIEVKTTLRNKDIKEGITNIESVKKLNYIRTKLPFFDRNASSFSLKVADSRPPLGIIFAYKTDKKKMETIKDQFNKYLECVENKNHFDLAFILDKGVLIAYEDQTIERKTLLRYSFIGFREEKGFAGIPYNMGKGKVMADYKGRKYPLLHYQNISYLIDPAKAFLRFLGLLYDSLENKHVIQWSIFRNYLPEDFFKVFLIDSEKA